MKKGIYVLLMLVLPSLLWAKHCEVADFDVKWTAFKSPNKVGVSGGFERLNLETHETDEPCIYSFLTMSTVHIDTTSLKADTQDMGTKIVTAFFKKLSEGYIDAIIKRIDVEAKEISVEITMNQVTQIVFMNYDFDGQTFNAKGKIDLANFGAEDALHSLNEACSVEHKGKTWSDVEISFMMKLTKPCEIDLK